MKFTLSCLVIVAAASSVGCATSAVHPCAAADNSSCTPILFLAEGPTGSGKTGQEELLIRLFNLRTEGLAKDPPRMLLIDDFVERDATYRANMLAYLKENLGETPTKEKIDSWLEHADATVYGFFDEQYFGCRKHWGCNFNGTGGCETAFYNVVHESFNQSHNVIWEVTGKRYPADKIEEAGHSKSHYEVVVGINVVDFCDLQKRNSGRAGRSIEKFMAHPEDLSIAAPRLPDLSGLGAAVDKIIKETLSVVDCVGEPISQQCPAKIDEMYVFSNEHWGFMPSIKVIPPIVNSSHAKNAFAEQKESAKKMLEYGLSHPCSPTLVI